MFLSDLYNKKNILNQSEYQLVALKKFQQILFHYEISVSKFHKTVFGLTYALTGIQKNSHLYDKYFTIQTKHHLYNVGVEVGNFYKVEVGSSRKAALII